MFPARRRTITYGKVGYKKSPNQTTLTQLQYVSSLEPEYDDDEYVDETPPKKKRRIGSSTPPTSSLHTQTLTQIGFVINDEDDQMVFRVEDSQDETEPLVSRQSTFANDGRPASVVPETPVGKTTKVEIPSSQSPESPLNIKLGSAERRSPLRDVSTNVTVAATPTPKSKLRRVTSVIGDSFSSGSPIPSSLTPVKASKSAKMSPVKKTRFALPPDSKESSADRDVESNRESKPYGETSLVIEIPDSDDDLDVDADEQDVVGGRDDGYGEIGADTQAAFDIILSSENQESQVVAPPASPDEFKDSGRSDTPSLRDGVDAEDVNTAKTKTATRKSPSIDTRGPQRSGRPLAKITDSGPDTGPESTSSASRRTRTPRRRPSKNGTSPPAAVDSSTVMTPTGNSSGSADGRERAIRPQPTPLRQSLRRRSQLPPVLPSQATTASNPSQMLPPPRPPSASKTVAVARTNTTTSVVEEYDDDNDGSPSQTQPPYSPPPFPSPSLLRTATQTQAREAARAVPSQPPTPTRADDDNDTLALLADRRPAIPSSLPLPDLSETQGTTVGRLPGGGGPFGSLWATATANANLTTSQELPMSLMESQMQRPPRMLLDDGRDVVLDSEDEE